MTHAFFKALLFLTAGGVIHALHHEHNIFRMGGLRRELPVTFWTFLIGGSALAGLPLITAGFYSKDLIIWDALTSRDGGIWLWAAGTAGVLLTSLYIYRLIFIVFFGEARTEVSKKPGFVMRLPLVVLGFLSLVGGFINLPDTELMKSSLPPLVGAHAGTISETFSKFIGAGAYAAGLYFAYLFFVRKRHYVEVLARSRSAMVLHKFWFADWGFDWLYETLFVRPVVWIAKIGKDDFIDSVYDGIAAVTRSCHRALSLTETGHVRWYAAAIAAGSVFFIACALIL
jgi:NADH-quinone oxidoreductase subunit L